MEELIRRSDAIKAIKDNSFALGDDYMEINGYGAIDDIRALPSADRPKGEWIPCSERLPERGEDVLITDEYGDVSIASIEYSTPHPWQSVYGTHIEYMVYAWMPLPEPWKGADDETAND